jgi:hypothetical protein
VAIDPQYVREHYASLSDEALLLVDRSDLTSTAQSIYDSEIRRRGLDARATTVESSSEADDSFFRSADEDDAEEDPEWIDAAFPVTTFSATSAGISDAADARAALIAAGIPCEVTEHEIDPEEQSAPQPFTEYRVLVPAAMSLQAISALDTAIYNPRYEADLKTQLESLSDDEFRSLDIESLCAGLLDRADRLRKTYKLEIARRSK